MFEMFRARLAGSATAGRGVALLTLACLVAASTGPAYGQVERTPEIQNAIDRGVAYFLGRTSRSELGQDALVTLALLKCGISEHDPAMAPRLEPIFASVAGAEFAPRNEHNGIYSAGIVAMILGMIDRAAYHDEIEKVSRYILQHQNENGSWNYPRSGLNKGDTSVTQYAMLGLWEASMSGIEISPAVFDRAAQWHVLAQDAETGAYGYRPLGEGDKNPRHTMTAGALGSLLICLRRGPTAKPVLKHRLLTPIVADDGQENATNQFVPTTSAADIRRTIARADGWLENRFTVENPTGQSHYYYFYALERYGALADLEQIGSVDWYQAVADRLIAEQSNDGHWSDRYGGPIDTSFALLFLSRATKQSVDKEPEVARLEGGILIGRRGLPTDFTQVVVRDQGFVVKPLEGNLEQLLSALETSRGYELESARLGLEATLRAGDPATRELGLKRLIEMASDPMAQTRQIAVWALARQESLEVVPTLLRALDDPDETVREEAQFGLRVLRRTFRPKGANPSTPEPTPPWRAWYLALNPDWRWNEP